MLSERDGKYLVALARRAITSYLKQGERISPRDATPNLLEKRGVFVTLETMPNRELRGCIGYPYPVYPLASAVIDAAISAATEDPRFPPLESEELEKLVIEVSVLTLPERIICKDPREIVKEVKVGRDGLTIESRSCSGLLLPQVPVEQEWGAEEFLAQICWKAGLPPDEWLSETAKVCRFQAQVFCERKPGGVVFEKNQGKR